MRELKNWREMRERKQQYFDKETITQTMAGKTYNVYDKIQEAREDTELYPTLEKYGCIPNAMQNTEELYNYMKSAVQTIDGKIDLRNVQDAQIAAENAFYNLPLEMRQHFDNSISKFQKEGKTYLKEKIAEMEVKQPKEQNNTTQTEGVANNG